MGGVSQGLLGVDTPSATRAGGATSSANLLSGTDPVGPTGMNTPRTPAEELNAGGVVDGQQVATYASNNAGTRVGDGECFALADRALRGAGAKSAADFGTVAAGADYIWGSEVTLGSVQVGDVIQFRNYKYSRVTVFDDGTNFGGDDHEEARPHHTAIVKAVGADGLITVWEQNVPPGSGSIRSIDLYFKSVQSGDDKNGTKVSVQGTAKFYRPQPRS
jgi:hypothetical protein